MRNHVLFLVAAAVVQTACGDSTGVQVDDLVGTWNATVFEFTNIADPSQKVDAIATGGSMSMTVTAGGAISLNITFGGMTESTTGTISVDGSNVTITTDGPADGDPASGTISLSGGTLTINLTSGVEFDFDDDGTDEPATVRIVMQQ